MSLNARQIGELVAELGPLFRGTRLRDVQALPPRDVLLVFEIDAAPVGKQSLPPVRRLRVSADPDHSRVHLQRGRVFRGKGPPGPFFRRLAEELAGAELRSVEQVRGDRIVLLEFRDTPSAQRRALLGELTGRHANLVLLGPDDRVLEVLVPAPAKRAAPRLVKGEPWRPPPGSPPARDDLPSITDELPLPEGGLDGRALAEAPLSGRVERALGGEVEEREDERARRELRKRCDRKLSKARSLLTGLTRRMEATAEAERVRQDGELVQANLARLTRGMKSCELEDWYTEGAPQRVVALDPKRSPSENAIAYFQRARKLEGAAAELPSEIARAEQRLARLEALRAAADDAEADPEELDARAVADGLLDPRQEADVRKRKAPAPRSPFRSFVGCKGSEIRVGRTARDNDDLTFHHARGNDLWLHTADVPGSHVVLRLEKGAEPDPEELLDAAHLAVHFSPQREARRAAVHVARRKEVHKPRGAKPGLVTVSGGRKLELRMQPERVKRLLAPDRS